MAIRVKTTKAGKVHYVETRGHWERVGSDKREAERLNARRKKEAKAGTFSPKVTGGVTVAKFLATWLDARTNRSADQDRMMLERHVLPRTEFSSRKMEDLTDSSAVQKLVNDIKAGPPKLAPKYIANIYGALHTAFRAAVRQGVINRDVCMLEPGTISKKSKERQPYTLDEARRLIAFAEGERRVWLALALFTGMRCGEVCGRRWRDWDPKAEPLGCLTIGTQYGDEPLKTDRPRRAPVHLELAELLNWWWSFGFELTYMRQPTADDFIVERLDAPGQPLTRSMTYKALERDCARAGVPRRGQHATRHTFITLARRSGSAKDLVEKITHNASAEMIDHYTHWEWSPLCSVVQGYPALLPTASETESETVVAETEKTSSSSRTRTGSDLGEQDKRSQSGEMGGDRDPLIPGEIVDSAAESCAVSGSTLHPIPALALALAAARLRIQPRVLTGGAA